MTDAIVATRDRANTPKTADERTTLEAWLEFHRMTLLQKCAGLSAPDLKRRAVEPSTLSLLGLVRHMTEVERGWFRNVLDGQDAPYYYVTDANPDAEFDDVDDADAAADVVRFEAEIETCRALVAAYDDLDAIGTRHRPSGEVQDYSLRWILVHMIEEYARHNGHADLLRQRIDGATGD